MEAYTSTHSLTVRIMHLFHIWSCSPGFGLVLMQLTLSLRDYINPFLGADTRGGTTGLSPLPSPWDFESTDKIDNSTTKTCIPATPPPWPHLAKILCQLLLFCNCKKNVFFSWGGGLVIVVNDGFPYSSFRWL